MEHSEEDRNADVHPNTVGGTAVLAHATDDEAPPTASYTIVEDLMGDNLGHLDDGRPYNHSHQQPSADVEAYAVATVEHWQDERTAVAAAANRPSVDDPYYHRQYEEVTTAEDEKEEIAELAGLPTAGVATWAEPATVMEDNLDDDEALIRQLKREAYGDDAAVVMNLTGHDNHPSSFEQEVPLLEPQPEPLPGEDFAQFHARTIDHWNIIAAEQLTAGGDAVMVEFNLETLQSLSTQLANQRFDHFQQPIHRATVVNSTSMGSAVDHQDDAIQAEWVGQRYEEEHVAATTQPTATTLDETISTHNNVATEATVIDTAPLAKHAWQTTEVEAQVLEQVVTSIDDGDMDTEEDRKPAAIPGRSSQEDDFQAAPVSQPPRIYSATRQSRSIPRFEAIPGGTNDEDYAVADQEGVVLAIEEDVHPAEWESQHSAADAEVVGQDFTTTTAEVVGAVATPTNLSQQPATEVQTTVHAVVLGGNTSSSSIATATATPATSAATHHAGQTVAVLPTESIAVEDNSASSTEAMSPPVTKEIPWSGLSSRHVTEDTPAAETDNTALMEDRGDASGEATPPPAGDSFGNGARDQSAASGTSDRSSSSQRNQLHNVSFVGGVHLPVLFRAQCLTPCLYISFRAILHGARGMSWMHCLVTPKGHSTGGKLAHQSAMLPVPSPLGPFCRGPSSLVRPTKW